MWALPAWDPGTINIPAATGQQALCLLGAVLSSPFGAHSACTPSLLRVPLVGPDTQGNVSSALFLALLSGLVIPMTQRGSVTCPPRPRGHAEPPVDSRRTL